MDRISTALHQRVRHAVPVAVEGDVIIDVDAGSGPLAQIETLGRAEAERRSVQRRKQTGADPLRLRNGSLIQACQAARVMASFKVGRSKNCRCRSAAMIQRSTTRTADFHLGLIARLVGPCRHDARP